MLEKCRYALITIAVLAISMGTAGACQYPPGSEVPCQLVPQSPVVQQGTPFSVFLSITNYPVTAPFPPPYRDDLPFTANSVVEQSFPTAPCGQLGLPATGDITPANYSVELDEAWSPFADEPTSDTRELVITPTGAGDFYAISSAVCPDVKCRFRTCYPRVCVQVVDDPSQHPTPYAMFLEPQKRGEAGSVLPFELRVLRNGYPKGVALTVRVVPENRSDPIDIFPLTPASLSTTGYIVNDDDEIIDFTCSLHYPCFVGVDNIYHITIHDGPNLLWDTRVTYADGVGRAVVNRSPMVRQDLVEIRDAGTDGSISMGEQAELELRLYARNPNFDALLDNGVLKTLIPEGLSFKSARFEKHDNPMDAYDPTPAELEAFGTIVSSVGDFEVALDNPLPSRFTGDPPFAQPITFDDMFEVILTLETTPGGYVGPGTILFPGLEFTANHAGDPKVETSAPLSIEVVQVLPPNPIDQLYVVKERPDDVLVTWSDPATDATHGSAFGYRVYRSLQNPESYVEIADQPDTVTVTENYADLGALSPLSPFDRIHFYRQVCHNNAGTSGDEP